MYSCSNFMGWHKCRQGWAHRKCRDASHKHNTQVKQRQCKQALKLACSSVQQGKHCMQGTLVFVKVMCDCGTSAAGETKRVQEALLRWLVTFQGHDFTHLEWATDESHDDIPIHVNLSNNRLLPVWPLHCCWLMHGLPAVLHCCLKCLLGIIHKNAYTVRMKKAYNQLVNKALMCNSMLTD